ncbi:MAG: hypothetical protein FWD13_08060 [Treponema sp.]|nr:hypothetical protein [Treponema sp.]
MKLFRISNNHGGHGGTRRFWYGGVFSSVKLRVVRGLLILIMFLFIVGCPFVVNEHENTEFVPVGVWVSDYDSYTITETHIEYVFDMSEWDFPNDVLKGYIEKAVDFSSDSGVLIIKVTEATYNTVNKYTGIYYSEYKNSSIKLSSAINPDFSPVETESLEDALLLFSVDNASTHVSVWGAYTK